jgi:polyhydroxybutyrate depolymerase
MVRLGVLFLAAVVMQLGAVGRLTAEPLQLMVDGQVRTVVLERPAAAGPRPTIVMLHGAGATTAREAQVTGLAQLGPREGFAVAFPEGRGARWNFFPPGRESAQDVAFFKSFGGVPDDVAFLKALVADLVKRGIADPKRVYLAGRSLGGVLALRMACHDAAPFAAIGLLISAMADVTGADCRPAKPLPLLMLSGTADQVIPYAGGSSRRGDGLWPAERLVAFFRGLNGCQDPAERSVLPGQRPHRIEVERSTKCSNGPVVFYRVVGGGHDTPADVGTLLMDFFRDQARDTKPAQSAAASATPKCMRLETRLFADLCGGCSRPPFNQEIVRTFNDEWTVTYVDGTNTRRSYKYRLVAENASEILLYDSSRDIHARLDLAGRKGFARRGTRGDWVPILNILTAHCS